MTETDNRGLLRVIKVPFDIKAIFLGALGYIVFVAGGWILDGIYKGVADGTHVMSQFIFQGLAACSVRLGEIPLIGGELVGLTRTLYGTPSAPLNTWEMIGAGVWFLLILSVFGGAICRIVALRISRDESTGAVAALKFAFQNLLSYLLIPVFLGGFIAFFVGCNALAGLACSIPVLGPVLFIVLFPLVIISSIIILLLAVGGLLGLFMMVAAVSTEKNGTLDAISRAFSYLYSRPVAFFFYYFLVYLVASIIILIGAKVFLGLVGSSFDLGFVNDSIQAAFRSGGGHALDLSLPKFGGFGWNAVMVFFAWLFMILLYIGVLGFVVSYILGGSTAIYFALRRDVDGTEDSEIYVEGAEEEEDFGLPPVTPPPAETDTTSEGPAATETPAETPAPEPEKKDEAPAVEAEKKEPSGGGDETAGDEKEEESGEDEKKE